MSTNITTYVAEHPKLAGVLFTIVLLLSQAGSVAAGNGACYPGP
jgi:hypothetical protein